MFSKFKILFLLLTLVSLPSFALGMVDFGLKVGMPYSKVKTETISSDYELGTYTVGGSLDFGAGSYGVNLDVLYSEKKMGYSPGISATITEIKIPVVFYYDFMPLRILAGGYYTKSTGDVKLSYPGGSVDFTYDSLGLKKADYGLVGGLGLKVPAGMVDILIEGRYNHGLANLNDAGVVTQNTSSIELLLGFFF